MQALVAALIDDVESGKPTPSYHRQLIAENKWNAARYGLEAPLMDLADRPAHARRGRRRSHAAG